MKFALLILFFFCNSYLNGQTFLDKYKTYQHKKINSSLAALRESNNRTNIKINKKQIKAVKVTLRHFLSAQFIQFDTIFKAYQKKTDFDFNSADSFTLIYQTSLESNLSDYMFFSARDTISYGELWFVSGTDTKRKVIRYKPFLDTSQRPIGIKVIDGRDTLLTLAGRRDCETAQRLAKENPVSDGMSTTILFVKKSREKYLITRCHLQAFGFVPIWRRE